MKVLKATNEQYDNLNGIRNGVNQIEFAKDANDNWIVGVEVKRDPVWSAYHDNFNELEEIDYSPIIEE